MDDSKLLPKNEKEYETLTLAVRIHSEDIRMEFVIEKYDMLIMKNLKRQKRKE